ncbi:unnamed protein product [Adineta steineri]|uniref:Peptidase M12A domain-containing protein n=1 Tax=Adineta steineri TaxID=433720 RepID=A0A813ZF99_9BILA|nr:unnamed protein product [Adineta steineri]
MINFSRNLYGIPLVPDSSGKLRHPEEIGGHYQGDIKLPVLSHGVAKRGVAMRGSYVRWPNGIVPYVISSDYASTEQNAIVYAMRLLENLTAVNNVPCVQFRDKVAADGDYYITISNGSGCSSYVGRYTGYTLNRTVTLQHPGCIYNGTIMHELIHTLDK